MINNYLYHHKEISFCGYSGSGKTTLICTILDELNSEYKIGYIKHDAHNFQMDKPGKDTYEARKSGANTVFAPSSPSSPIQARRSVPLLSTLGLP